VGRCPAALRLPTFEIEGLTLYKRLTLVAEDVYGRRFGDRV